MVKIFNPVRGTDPLAATLSNLGKQMFGDRTGNALASEKLYAAERQNAETDNLMKRVAGGGAQALGSDPVAQAMVLGSGYSPADFGKIGLMGAATSYGAADPRTQAWQVGTGQGYDNTAGAFDQKLGEMIRNNNLQSADRRYGVDQGVGEKRYEFNNVSANDAVKNAEAMRNNNLQSADRRYGVDQTVGENAHEFAAKPIAALDAQGNPVFAPQGAATSGGFQPVLSNSDRQGTIVGQNFDKLSSLDPNQQEYLGARVGANKAGTPHNYIVKGPNGQAKTFLTADGVTDMQTGQPLPPGGYIGNVQGGAGDVGVTNSVASGLQENTIDNKKFNYLIDQGLTLTADPKLFGPQGYIRSLGQEAGAGIAGLSSVFGKGTDGEKAIEQARAEAASVPGLQHALPELFDAYDPNLPKVDTVWGMLVYQGAKALAGQSGRGISDKDVKEMRKILGDPQSLFSSAQMMRSKLNSAREIVNNYDQISREALGGNAPVAAAPGQLAPEATTQDVAPSAPAAPAGGPAPGVVEDGYQFLGGDPANPANWKQVQ